jgi:hypothetical protein
MRSGRLAFGWILTAGSLWLVACGPVYKTYSHYIPPDDPQGKTCALQCNSQRMQCESLCRRDYDNCIQRAELFGKQKYLDAKEAYLEEKEHCLERGDKKCQDISPPSESSYIRDSHCRQDCGCEPSFDRCFEICGGQIQRHTRCVSNCG